MAQAFVTRIKTNLNGVLQMTQMVDGIMMTGDDRANQIIVSLHRDRDPYMIPTGTKIVGYFIRSDGITLQIDGSVIADGDDAGKALVVIPALAYQIPGTLSISIRMFNDPSEVSQRGYYEKIETDQFEIVTNTSVIVGPNGEPVITRTVYENVNKRGYYQLNTDVFVVEEDESVTEGPNGEPIVTIVISESHQERGYYKIEVGEFIIVDDPNVTQGPHGEPVIIRTITEYANKTVIAAAACFVQMTDTDSVIEPGHLIPDINDVIAMLAKMDEQDHIWMADENIRIANEHTRLEQEAARVAAENIRVSSENTRISSENARIAAENTRVSNENARITAETNRASAETTRISNENTRKSNETARVNAEAARVTAESNRVTAESGRVNAESGRVTNETARVSAELGRSNAESTRVSNENTRKSNESARQTAETNRASAESTRNTNENTRKSNETTRQNNETTRQSQETARQNAIQNMTVAATARAYNQSPTATISDVDGHKHIVFGLVPGHPFVIKKSFATVAAMNAYSGSDIVLYDFVIITSNVEDPDNAKMYMKSSTGTGANTWTFITDLSGSQGIQGPKGDTGNGIASAVVNSSYQIVITFTDGTSYTSGSVRGPQGNKGDKGDKGDKGEPGSGGADVTYDATNQKLTVAFG